MDPPQDRNILSSTLDATMSGIEESSFPNNAYGNGKPSSIPPEYQTSNPAFSPPLAETDPISRSNRSPEMTHPRRSGSRPASRPGSQGLGPDRYPPSSYQEQNPKSSQQGRDKNTVVIKVGMVGDAQIGKTSLMVKYVEGSWDEDYIQTLGKSAVTWM